MKQSLLKKVFMKVFTEDLPRKRHFLGPAGTKLNFNLFEQSQLNILTILLGLKAWDPSTITHPNLRPQARKIIWLGLTLNLRRYLYLYLYPYLYL